MKRRNLLTGTAATLVVPVSATAAPSPDAALIADCETYIHDERAWVAEFSGKDEDMPDPPAGHEARFDRIAQADALTLEGTRAKARAVIASTCMNAFVHDMTTWGAWCILHELAGIKVVS